MPIVTDPILTGKVCPYCGKESELIDSAEVYGQSYGWILIHHYLDQLWGSGRYSRYSTYTWLSRQLGIPRELTHVGMSDIDQCNRIAEICRERLIHFWEQYPPSFAWMKQ